MSQEKGRKPDRTELNPGKGWREMLSLRKSLELFIKKPDLGGVELQKTLHL